MRLGLCCTPEEGPTALAMGYDYVEYPAASTEPSETTNLFFPDGVVLLNGTMSPRQEALEKGMEIIEAASARGVELMVLGSGTARRAPEGVPDLYSSNAFYSAAAFLDHYAQNYGMRVAPESLNSGETNVGTNLPYMAWGLSIAGVGYTADSYHALVEEDQPFATPEFWRIQIPFAPLHVHFAPFDRRVPSNREPSLKSFFSRLRELGYDGRASLECRRDGIPDPAPLRELFES